MDGPNTPRSRVVCAQTGEYTCIVSVTKRISFERISKYSISFNAYDSSATIFFLGESAAVTSGGLAGVLQLL